MSNPPPASPAFLLDTDVLIDLTQERPAAVAWMEILPDIPAVAGFAAMELIAGCLNGRELKQLQRFLRAFPLLWPVETDMQRALAEYLPLRLAHGIGLLDTVIAATATGVDLTLVTLNMRHFQRIPGLKLLRPYMK
jgi:predicted nucleic acid-binding protein